MNNETKQLAQRILETGKLMRDRVYDVQAQAMNQRTMARRYGELTQSQLESIRVIRKNGPLGINELAEHLGISSPSASVMADRLVEKKILERTVNPHDRRKVTISVSKNALKDIEAIEQAILVFFMDLVDRLGPDTAKAWSEVLEKVEMILRPDTLKSL